MQPIYTLISVRMNLLSRRDGDFSKLENNFRYSHWDKENQLTRRVSQINVLLCKAFQQSSKLKIARSLIVHVLPSSYYVTRFELEYSWKATEQNRICVSNNIVLNNVSVNNEWIDANNTVSKIWFMPTFPLHEYSQIISYISSEHMSQNSTKIATLDSSFAKYGFLRYRVNFKCATSVSVVVFFLVWLFS